MRLPRLAAEALELTRLPGAKIEMTGETACRGYYVAFTRRHARWRVIQNKRWGVALVALPERPEDYPRQVSRLMRRRVKRATEAGFTFVQVDPVQRLDEILAINRSSAERQGRPMHADYFDEEAVRQYFGRAGEVFGVADAAGILRAYLTLRTCGDVAFIERLLGHADALEEGVMYLLIMGSIQEVIERRQAEGRPKWFMYDMFPGASDGIRTFKHVIGCRPYRVSWSWRDQAGPR